MATLLISEIYHFSSLLCPKFPLFSSHAHHARARARASSRTYTYIYARTHIDRRKIVRYTIKMINKFFVRLSQSVSPHLLAQNHLISFSRPNFHHFSVS